METLYDGQTLQYSYDDLSRLLAADYFAAWDAVNPVREYDFSYDVAGNRTSEVVNVNGSPFSSQTHTYDAANRISNAGFAYNDAGQMTADGTLSYSWDRAGRLLGAGDSSYAYNGLGQRVQQTVSGVVTDYLLDVQPGLAKVIAAMTGANTDRFVHERGLLSQQDSNGDWQWMVTDGLGSVRGVVDGTGFDPAYSVHYAPYGQPWGEQGTEQTPFGFTGEPTDDNGLVHLRARYYNPSLGVFPSLDPVEGMLQQAMSLNRYAYVAGNVVNAVDPSGNASVEIWAAAFIEPSEIQFPHPAAVTMATWDGDDRSWYNGTQALPMSSRIWWWVQFDTCAISTFNSSQDTGITRATYYSWDPGLWLPMTPGLSRPPGYKYHDESDKAPPPDPATIRFWVNTSQGQRFEFYEVHIEGAGSNPLISFSPAIEINHDIVFSLATNDIRVRSRVDRYPWHELWISVNGTGVYALQLPPRGPTQTAFDLAPSAEFLPNITVTLGASVNLSCAAFGFRTSPSMLVNIPAIVNTFAKNEGLKGL